MASHADSSDKGSELGRGGDEDPSCRVKNVIPTGTLFAAALERLNRQSIVHLLEEIAREVDHHCQTFGTQAADGLGKLRIELLALIVALQKTADKHQGETQIIHQQIAELRLTKQQSETELKALRARIDPLAEQLEKLRAASTELSANELKQVEALIQKTQIGPLNVKVNNRVFVLEQLLEVLATADKVQDTHIDYTDIHISGARLVLADRTQVVFTCSRREEGDRLHYHFHAPDWKGLQASFSMTFERQKKTLQMCGRSHVLNTYDGVYYSNIKFDLCAQAGARPAPNQDTPPPPPPAPAPSRSHRR